MITVHVYIPEVVYTYGIAPAAGAVLAVLLMVRLLRGLRG